MPHEEGGAGAGDGADEKATGDAGEGAGDGAHEALCIRGSRPVSSEGSCGVRGSEACVSALFSLPQQQREEEETCGLTDCVLMSLVMQGTSEHTFTASLGENAFSLKPKDNSSRTVLNILYSNTRYNTHSP